MSDLYNAMDDEIHELRAQVSSLIEECADLRRERDLTEHDRCTASQRVDAREHEIRCAQRERDEAKTALAAYRKHCAENHIGADWTSVGFEHHKAAMGVERLGRLGYKDEAEAIDRCIMSMAKRIDLIRASGEEDDALIEAAQEKIAALRDALCEILVVAESAGMARGDQFTQQWRDNLTSARDKGICALKEK